MSRRCTIVMYHYVRPLAGSGIKGLDVSQFDGQLDYLQKHYRLIGVDTLLDALDGGEALPPMSALLTFDDGMIDHYTHVFPRLRDRGLTGAFFPPATVVLERRLLDVHKVHHILASGTPAALLADRIDRGCAAAREQYALADISAYRSQYAVANRFDPAEVIYVKRMLQHALPEGLRAEITDALFHEYVAADQKAFADSFYVSEAQWREMIAAGMHVGSHGDTHQWLSRLDDEGQKREIDASAAFLRRLGMKRLTICYPYGDQDARARDFSAAAGFEAGFTTVVDLAQISDENRLTLERLDTNDLPKTGDATATEWTQRATRA
jgi:peptidoglycan/xylan/chitin deacetylase (PgdA/CDA1 family)